MLIDEGLELLTDRECRHLLAQGEVGRIGISIGALPVIFPVNYRLIDGSIVFRTAPGSKLAAASRHTVVAFEVDDYDRDRRTGWSVLVVGHAEVVHGLDMTAKVLAAKVEPWAEGPRTSIVRIALEYVSGRRILPSRPAVPGDGVEGTAADAG
jgi:nitroimidazol reductase NimA-like FMN-containing flavoprotein (pyridoxamine 5'-phosphate oxidase superfamily)